MREEPIRRPRISEEIVRRLERAIREGEYKVGVQLPSERELMQRYGVGRSAIREALYALRKSGLIELKSGSRPKVTEPNARAVLMELSAAARYFLDRPSGVRDLQGLRLLFEVALVRDAALRSTRQDLQRMKRALNANRRALPDREAFIMTDIAFHFGLAARTGNPVITAIHDAMVEWLDEQREVALLKTG
ncbi:MAG TPA: GntR family transcriptional regulator, partial [Longimicrobiaceae bacterium]|nr:GntR family transcriptional regulator [Longimicrobiaceae bacterium]